MHDTPQQTLTSVQSSLCPENLVETCVSQFCQNQLIQIN